MSARRELTVYNNVGSVMSSMIPSSKMYGSPGLTSEIKKWSISGGSETIWLCIFSERNNEWPAVHLTDVTQRDWGSYINSPLMY